MKHGLHIGKVLDDKYKLLRSLGSGGMGEVYLGKLVNSDDLVAVKLLHSVLASDDTVVKRFQREAQATAAIKHENIIDVFDVGISPWGDPFIVMEYLQGESLAQMIVRLGTLSLETAMGLLEPVLLALQAVHDGGIVHRDLKPENIFIQVDDSGNPSVKIIDFGISKFAVSGTTAQTKLTADGSLLGTPSYMSPEQARGKGEVDHRSDLFSLGVILYEVLAGDLPFDGDNYNAMLIAMLTEEPKPPLDVNPDFPRAIVPFVLRALEKNRKNRFQSATQMLRELEQIEGFSQRNDAFSHTARSIVNKTTAIGDLGVTTVSSHGPLEVLEGASTSDGIRRWPGSWYDKLRQRKMLPTLALIVSVLLVGTLGILLGLGVFKKQPDQESLKSDTIHSEPKAGVVIRVSDLPDDAVVYYDDVRVPENPFRVEKKQTIATLLVTAPGYKDYTVAVTPDQDRTVTVTMKKIPKKYDVYKKLTKPLIRAVYNKKKKQLEQCYKSAVASKELPKSKVFFSKLTVHISPNGEVKRVFLSGEVAQYPKFVRCVSGAVKTWEFPKSLEGATERIPVEFSSQ